MNNVKFLLKRLFFTRNYSVQWGYECDLQFYNNTLDVNYKHLMKYIDTDINNTNKKSVLILPDNPGDSDDYIELCHNLYKCNYRVIIPNYPRTEKVKNISFCKTEIYSSETSLSYLATFVTNLRLPRLDFIVAHGWSGYDALFLESMMMSNTDVVLINFPKIFDINDAYIGSIPIEMTRTMLELWGRLSMRTFFKLYLTYKLPVLRDNPQFAHLSFDDIVTSLLYYGGLDLNKAKQSALMNQSRSLGLLNMPGHSPRCKIGDQEMYRIYLGLLKSDISTISMDEWSHVKARKRYEINLLSDSQDTSINSRLFGDFLVAWMEWLSERNLDMKRLMQ